MFKGGDGVLELTNPDDMLTTGIEIVASPPGKKLTTITLLSGGEKVRCMLSKLMLSNANVLVLDDPTNHLDLESITSVNKGLEKFPGVLLFNSHDQEMIQTLANRIIEITPGGIMDRKTTLEEYLENKDIQAQLKKMYELQNA